MYKSRIHNAKQRGKNVKARDLELPDNEQEFAVVERMLGNGRVEVYCEDKALRTVRIRGSMRKYKSKVIIENGDLVLIARWAFEADKGDLIHKYTHEEKSYLMYQQMITENIHKKLNKVSGGIGFQPDDADDDHIIFGDDTTTYKHESKKPTENDDDLNIDDI
jgi:translation initiation factor 1A